VQSELARALLDGPGIVVFRGAFDPAVMDRATGVFTAMIEEQKAAGVVGGDHFAKPGANDRVNPGGQAQVAHRDYHLGFTSRSSPYFEANHVQLPLEKGDAVFFNPALFHGAGTNRSADVRRMANLLQVSSAFGRTMETVDRTAMCRSLYPVLGGFTGNVANVVAAAEATRSPPTWTVTSRSAGWPRRPRRSCCGRR
jgi:ectoine hydroxylase-related dioxygenase (phytanoyl-CoA dioxygenase family)